jgi:branched-chain amino acid transport system substrate-binding protein
MVQDNVDAVVEGADVDPGDIARIVTKAGLAYFTASGGGTPAELTSPGSFVIGGGTTAHIETMGIYAKQKGYKKVALITLSVSSTEAAWQAAKPVFSALGLNASESEVPIGEPNMTPQVEAALQAKPDALMLVLDPTSGAAAYSAVSSLQSTIPIITASAGLLPNAPAGTIITSLYSPQGQSTTLYETEMAKYAPSVQPFGAQQPFEGWESMLDFLQGIEGMTGPVNAQSIVQRLSTVKNVPVALVPDATYTCSGNLVPGAPRVCNDDEVIVAAGSNGVSSSTYVSTVSPSAELKTLGINVTGG